MGAGCRVEPGTNYLQSQGSGVEGLQFMGIDVEH